ncbi:zinc finger protein 64 isoform X1 [Labrus bergylta]|uniref:zinc finger protein 64 isoform X1 n=2 Tax=Labrus bergylta TaxID=56723 RepID=UPI0033134973
MRKTFSKTSTNMATYNAEVAAGHSVLVEVSPDIHICGFCKQQYNNFEVFLAHKQNGCSLPTSDTSTTTTLPDPSTEFVFEETYQSCVRRGVKKILTKAQKTPSKKLKPALTSKRHSCCFSGCTFKTQYGQKDMERHLKTHTGEKPFECELCHKRFSRRDKLNMHSRSHTGEKPHKCKHCPYAAADSSSLKKHLRIHYDERPFKCQICPYASRNSSQLTVHLRSHTGDSPFQCSQCDAKFKINSDLKRHVRIHSGEKPYKCDFCDYRCAMKGNLKSHIQIKHNSGDSLKCGHCDFQCASKTALRQHTREHQPVQPMQCSKCTYSCTSKGALKVHERIHSEERPFKCDFCNFASKQRSNLVIHKKKCHSDKPEKGGRGTGGKLGGKSGGGDPPKLPAGSRYRAKLEAARAFCCDSCDASFVREDSLRSHKKQHREAQNVLQLQTCTPPDAVNMVPVATSQNGAQLHVPLQSDSMAPYSSAQLKIIVSHPLSQENTLIPATVDAQSKTNMVLLSPESQDMVVNSMIHQVNLLAPIQPLGSSQAAEATVEPQAVLLTQLAPDDASSQLHQALLHTAITAQDSSGGSQTFITTCSELEGLNALIQEGGTEVTVVTEGNTAVVMNPPDMVCGPSEEPVQRTVQSALTCEESALLVPNITLSSQNVVIHSVPLIVSTQAQQLSPHTLYSDSHTLE